MLQSLEKSREYAVDMLSRSLQVIIDFEKELLCLGFPKSKIPILNNTYVPKLLMANTNGKLSNVFQFYIIIKNLINLQYGCLQYECTIGMLG